MAQYAPLRPVEPPISYNPYEKQAGYQPFRGPTAFHSSRTFRVPLTRQELVSDDEGRETYHRSLLDGRSDGSTGCEKPYLNLENAHGGTYQGDDTASVVRERHCYSNGHTHYQSRRSLSPRSRDAMLHHADHHRPRSLPSGTTPYPASVHYTPHTYHGPVLRTAFSDSYYYDRPPYPEPSPTSYGSSPTSTNQSSRSTQHSRSSPSSNTAPSISASCAAIRTSHPPNYTYTLSIRQQPLAARACGQGERDRRTVDPPPIIQLHITDTCTGAPVEDSNALLALTCTLLRIDPSGSISEADMATPTAPGRKLMGQTVISPYQGKDDSGASGTFFVLSDLSCRDPGRHKLRFTLVRLDPLMLMPGTRHPTVAVVESESFDVFVAKDFPGMRASSSLLRGLRRHGLNVPLKKGRESRGGGGEEEQEGDEDERSETSEEGDDGFVDGEGGDDELLKGKRRLGVKRRGKRMKCD